MITRRIAVLGLAGAAPAILRHAARASTPDKVRVGVFPVSSALPFFVAKTRGYFSDVGVDAIPTQMASSTMILGAFLTGDLDTAATMVTIEALNINLKSPGAVVFISLNGQNAQHPQEAMVIRNGIEVNSIAELKGKATRIMAASGPANTSMARAVLKANGLQEGRDYMLTDLALGLHVGAMTAGTFDAGYTLEPAATILQTNGGARVLQKGLISTYVLDNPDALAFAAGGAMRGGFVRSQPDVAKRYAAAWQRALADIIADPAARDVLKGNTATPSDLVRQVGVPLAKMTDQLTADDRSYFQKFIDFATEQKVVTGHVDTAATVVTL